MRLPLLAMFLITLMSASIGLPQAEPSPANGDKPSPSAVAMLQSHAEAFLRNLYAWGSEFEVTAGDVNSSVIPGLYEIDLKVTLNGRTDSAVVYVTKDGHYMVRGEITDMTTDPFAEIRQKLVLGDSPSKGPLDASVVIVEFGDFQCPSCRALEMVLRRLLPDYPQVRLVFKDFPLEQIHPWAMSAALVGQCAYKLGGNDSFWRVHDVIYDNQDQITAETASDKLMQLAADAGTDPTAMRACVAAPETTTSVRKNIAEGRSVGVEGTPTTFVNGRPVVGPNEQLFRQFLQFLK
jgi:protein-disulfide isomerase